VAKVEVVRELPPDGGGGTVLVRVGDQFFAVITTHTRFLGERTVVLRATEAGEIVSRRKIAGGLWCSRLDAIMLLSSQSPGC
jgi:hypothetical protein